MADIKTEAPDNSDIADANLARLAIRDLERTMDQLIDVDGRALSLASRAGQMFLDGKVPVDRQEELVRTMEQVVNTSIEARKVIKEVSQMVSVTKAASSASRSEGSGGGKSQSDGDTPSPSMSSGEQQRLATRRQLRLTKMRI